MRSSVARLCALLACATALPVAHAQSSFTASWPLSSTSQYTGTATGNAVAYQEVIGTGTPPMSVFNYTAQGQRLYMGNPGWVAGTEDPTRYAEFNAAATAGQALTVTSVLFEYGATVTANSMAGNVYYSTDGWITRTQLGATLAYPTPGMGIFTASPNVTVPAGSFFSLRIYPFAVTSQMAGSPQFAVHNSVTLSGTTAPASGTCTPPPSGMTGWWDGDGNANDLTTNANHGTLMGAATYAAGKVGQAFSFASNADYVTVPDAPALNFGTGSFTIDAWVRTTTPTAMIVSKNGGTGTNPVGYSFYITSGQLTLVINDGTQGLGVAGGNLGTPLNDGQWHFVAVTLQRGSPSTFTFYVDGQQTVSSTTGSVNPTGSISNTAPQLIGRYQFIPNFGTPQQIDELEVFNRVLTGAEIAAIYTAGAAGKCKTPPTQPTGLVCGTKFNDLDGNGVRSGTEPGLPNWTIHLSHGTNPNALPTTVSTGTDGTGAYCFANLLARTYSLSEVQQTGWTQTAPAPPGTHTVPLAAGQTVTGLDFGNRQAVCTPPPSGMTGWWDGDGTPNDLTTNANHGTLVGAATYGPGKVGQAFSFATANDYVSVPDAPALNVGTGDFSIDAWVRTTSSDAQLINKSSGTLSNLTGYYMRIASGLISYGWGDGNVQVNGVTISSTPLNDGQWHFVAMTVQRGSPSTLSVYADGQLIASTPMSGTNNPTGSLTNTAPLLIGRNTAFQSSGFVGQLDEVELFNRVLTAAEIAAIYDAGTAGKCKSSPPPPTGSICGIKFNDLNGDGLLGLNGSEPGLPGWTIHLTGPGSPPFTASTTTGSDGAYCFANLSPGMYTLAEVNQTGWQQTFPGAPGTHAVALAAGDIVNHVNFGNRQAATCIAPPSGMTSWWDGDGTPNDLTTNANHGTLVGAATYGPGMVGQAFSFASSADYVTVPDAPALNVGTGSFSIDGWIRTTAPYAVILSKMSGTMSTAVGYALTLQGADLNFQWGDGNFNYTLGANGTTPFTLNDGQWHFVAVTVQRGTPSTITLYVDGQVVYSFTTNTPTNNLGSLTNTAPLQIGRHQVFGTTGFPGEIDEIEVFHRVLTPTEITALYAAGSGGKCKTPTDVERLPMPAPSGYELGANHPNPFTPSTQIRYGVPQDGHVRLEVFDLLGRRVATLVDGVQAAGRYEVVFDGSGLSDGVYLYRMAAGTFVETRRMVLAR